MNTQAHKLSSCDFIVDHKYKTVDIHKFGRVVSDVLSLFFDKRLNQPLPLHRAHEFALKLTDGKCFWCGKAMTTGRNIKTTKEGIAWDHFLPASLGGLFVPGNVVVSCITCNSQKNNTRPDKYWRQRFDSGDRLLFKTEEAFEKARDALDEELRESSVNYIPATETPPIMNMVEYMVLDPGANEFVSSFHDRKHVAESDALISMRPDRSIWADLRQAESEVYVKNKWAPTTIEDVRGRVGRTLKLYHNVHGKAMVNDLSDEEFADFCAYVLKNCGVKSRGEYYKYRQLLRTLAGHESVPESFVVIAESAVLTKKARRW